jgi:membrane protease YdiL (CAAX protease family)
MLHKNNNAKKIPLSKIINLPNRQIFILSMYGILSFGCIVVTTDALNILSPYSGIALMGLIFFLGSIGFLYFKVKRMEKYHFASLRLRQPGWNLWLAYIILSVTIFNVCFWIIRLGLFDPSLPMKKSPMEFKDALPGGQIMTYIHTVVFAPIFEEVLFRGVIQRGLENITGGHIAIFISALSFALLHDNPDLFPFHLVHGVLYGYLVYATKNLWTGIIVHSASNTIISTLHYLGITTAFYKQLAFSSINIIVALIIGLLSTASIIYLLASRMKINNKRPLYLLKRWIMPKLSSIKV